MSSYDLPFWNLSVIFSVYTDGILSSLYLRMYFTVELILLVTSSVWVTRHLYELHVIILFGFFYSLFSHCNSLGIYWRNFSLGVYRWILGCKIMSIKVITIYRWKNYLCWLKKNRNKVLIHLFNSSKCWSTKSMLTYNKI
jgi:hypothetical protein